ncbi:MAG: sulfotransferase [Alphaproteobacteria bacterium]|nr:sulfotransferase [Alphaproteobacteria bacterium]MDE2266127.1 sulfotransferase [Alphaproteobacteria bacterium]
MKSGIHFISGLPRSGTTLLSALLMQNPRFHAGVTTPLYQMVTTLQGQMSARSEFYPFFDDDKRRTILRGVFSNYYEKIHPKQLVFDTNRWWTSKLPTIVELFPRARMVCCVRSVAWIIDSLERLLRRNALEPSRIFNFEATNNVYTRAEAMNAAGTGLIGAPYNGLREAFYGEHSDRLMLVTYESLARSPVTTMAAIYEFLGEEPFGHDFKNLKFETDEYDAGIGMTGLHRVAKVVEFKERGTILPPDLFKRFEGTEFWKAPNRNPRNVKVV